MPKARYECCEHCIWLPTDDERFCSPEVVASGGHERQCGIRGCKPARETGRNDG